MLFLPGFLGNCCCYLVTALVQHGVLQWSQLFIVQEKHQSVLTGTHVLLSVMKEFMFSLYELHSSIHCRILFLNLHADYEVGFVPFGFSIVPVFATFMPTWTTKDLQVIYCLKNNLILYDMCLSLNVHYHLIMIYVDFELSPISCCDLSTIDNNYISCANFKKFY